MVTKMKSPVSVVTSLILCAVFAQSALAEGNAERGEALAYTCLGCHGIEGYRNAYPAYRVPKLGGQKAAYLEAAVKGYRDGTREHPTMVAQASSLSDEEIADVAAYLASIGNDTVAAGGSEPAPIEEVQLCSSCHGANGIGLSPTWPTLAGQHEDYLVQALNAYIDGTRTDPVMSASAAQVDPDDVKLLARYFSRLEGLETTKPE